jgi:hypothetical protein
LFIAASFSATAVATNWLTLNAFPLRAAFDLGLDRAGEAKWVGALVLYVLILRIVSAGISSSIPNLTGTEPKSRWLNVTIAAARPLTAASRTSSSRGRAR